MARVRKRKNALMALAFLLPALLIYGLFNGYSVVMTLYYSLMSWTGISQSMNFIGLSNYIKLLQGGSDIWRALGNNLLLVVVSLAVQLPFGLILALIINAKIAGMRFFRTVFFMPMLLSTVATGILWNLMYDPNFGLINKVLQQLGLGSLARPWIGSSQLAIWAVMFVICWQYTPQYMILLRAGLTNIPEDLYEAAKIDGASGWRQFLSITLPMLSPTIKTSATLSLVGSLKYFDLIYVLTGGNQKTDVMATYMYKRGFQEFNMGYASSVAGFMFLISLVCVAVFQSATSKGQEGEGN